jgi:hypothetical protein
MGRMENGQRCLSWETFSDGENKGEQTKHWQQRRAALPSVTLSSSRLRPGPALVLVGFYIIIIIIITITMANKIIITIISTCIL